ncbi:RNA guanine-N7 methyltransferase activating subunit isoform X2 [Ochlerotatus camptorhynchus]|uniref:RNA guanine-N7 methyltransferase activating subunit isoform X2 n=1 Tax=Ochlerotatus camptorhynchus TaxID=644619 RepID=UPI0031D10393
MVDPKRHINVICEEDQLFLNECEEEFKDRFTEDDSEFTAYCAQQSRPPPVLEPWQSRNFQGGYGGGGGGSRGRFNDRGRGGGGGRYNSHNWNRDYRDRPYQQHGNPYNNRGGRDNSRYNSNVGRNYS